MTAYGAVTHGGETQAGDQVVIVATGGVGSMVVQVARAAGASRVVAVDLGAEKLDAARRARRHRCGRRRAPRMRSRGCSS